MQLTSTPASYQDAISKAASAFRVSGSLATPVPEQDILANDLKLVLDGFTSSYLQAVS